MAGTNIVAVKRALIAALRERLNIECSYSYVGKLHGASREYLFLGEKASGSMTAAAMAGGTRFLRDEEATFQLVILVSTPGDTTEAAEARAVELGTAVEEYLAGNWTQGGEIPGLSKTAATSYDLESGVNDDGAEVALAYTIQLESHVR